MPKAKSTRADAAQSIRRSAPPKRRTALRMGPSAAAPAAKAPDLKVSCLPPELTQAVLWAGFPWSTGDARALSQSCHAFDAWISGAQPQTYRQAHHKSLIKALGTRPFGFGNPRVQNVLGSFDALHLTDDCDLGRTDARRLARIINAMRRAKAVHLDTRRNSVPPWTRLFEAGLQAGALTSLNLAATNLPWAEVEQFFGALAQLTSLEQLVLSTSGFRPEYTRSLTCSVGFEPLTNLRKLTWRTPCGQGQTRVDVSTNKKLRHLELDFGSFGLGFQGWELDHYPFRNTLLLPPAPLEVLRLEAVVVSPATAHHLSKAPWQDSLMELYLTFGGDVASPQLDLSTHTALKQLFLSYDGKEITGLRLPPPQRLETLSLTGNALASLLQQLGTPIDSALTTLFLDCKVNQAPTASSIPWASLPGLKNLICWSWYNRADAMRLRSLNIPEPNVLQGLRLCDTIISPDEWHFEDLALKGLSMPCLRTLDLSGLVAVDDETIGAIIGSVEAALSQHDRWPVLEEIVASGATYPSELGAALSQMAMRLGLRCTLTERYVRPHWAL